MQISAPILRELAGPVTIEHASLQSAAAWDRFVRTRSDATGYHLWGWRDVFARAFRQPCHYLVARQEGEITGILPTVEMKNLLFGRALSSLPYVNYGGVLAATGAARDALLTHAAGLARERGLSYVLLRHRQRVYPELPARTHKATMLLPLASGRDAMWNGLDRKVRNQIRKAEKSNLTMASGGAELLPEFYAVFARNMRDLGTPVYGEELFGSILQAFPEDARLHVVRLGTQAVAVAFTYAYGDTIEVPSASSLREHRSLCPNHLLYWSMMSDAIAQGRRTFDFGRSTPHDGTWHFKEQWGAEPAPLYWEYSLTSGARVPTEDRHSAKFQTSIEAWKRLPLAVATRLGPSIARAIP